jgi:hypothetical protein
MGASGAAWAGHRPHPAHPIRASRHIQAASLVPAQPFQLPGGLDNAARDVDCLTAAVYYEARGESPDGQAAVAQVVLNRVRHPAFPKSICGVVFQGMHSDNGCQFSFACNGSMTRPREPDAWARAQDIATHALTGGVMAAVGNATNFHAARVGLSWGGGMVRVARIGMHIFYRLSGYAGDPDMFILQPERSLDEPKPVQAEERPVGQYVLASVPAKASTPPAPVAPPAKAPAPIAKAPSSAAAG